MSADRRLRREQSKPEKPGSGLVPIRRGDTPRTPTPDELASMVYHSARMRSRAHAMFRERLESAQRRNVSSPIYTLAKIRDLRQEERALEQAVSRLSESLIEHAQKHHNIQRDSVVLNLDMVGPDLAMSRESPERLVELLELRPGIVLGQVLISGLTCLRATNGLVVAPYRDGSLIGLEWAVESFLAEHDGQSKDSSSGETNEGC